MTTHQTAVTKSMIGLILGAAAAFGGAEGALAASDYKVIRQDPVLLGDWEHHQPWMLLKFYVPKDVDRNAKVVLQMNVNSTNLSPQNALYLNPNVIPGDFEGCDSIHQDRNETSRIALLPYVDHERWQAYHQVVEGGYLHAGDNYLLVCSRNEHGDGRGNLDNFYLKDIVLHYREYEPAPQFCPTVYEPVCGANGVTYSNACAADQAPVEILYEGACSL